MQRVDDLASPPVIGETYLVPSVQLRQSDLWWPVIGSAHADADLGVPHPHLHHDVRFLSSTRLALVLAPFDLLPGECIARLVMTHVARVNSVAVGPIHQPFRCERAMPDMSEGVAVKLEATYRDARVQCGRCPHRGMPLESLPVRPDGTVICAGHGLRWNRETGRLVPRSEPLAILGRVLAGLKGGMA